MDELQNELIRIKKFSKDLQEHQENYRDSETKIKEIEAQEEVLSCFSVLLISASKISNI